MFSNGRSEIAVEHTRTSGVQSWNAGKVAEIDGRQTLGIASWSRNNGREPRGYRWSGGAGANPQPAGGTVLPHDQTSPPER